MADKYLKLVSGIPTGTEATTTSAGAGDSGKIVALNSSGQVDETMMPTGVTADVRLVIASENLAAGDLVNLWNDGGTLKARKAIATSAGTRASGFVKAAYNTAATATVFVKGNNDQLSGLTIGAFLYLSGTTAGAVTSTAPTTSGHIAQPVGQAITATSATIDIDYIYVN